MGWPNAYLHPAPQLDGSVAGSLIRRSVIGIWLTVMIVADDEFVQLTALPGHGAEQAHVFTRGEIVEE